MNKFLKYVVSLLSITICLNGCLGSKEKIWQIKAKDEKAYMLKLVTHDSEKKDKTFFDYTGKIFACSFAPLYPEAGIKKYTIKHRKKKPTGETKEDVKKLTEKRKQKFAKIVKEHKQKLIEYAQEYFISDFHQNYVPPFKKLIKKGEFFSFVIFQGNKPVGFALFTNSFIKDGVIIPAEEGTKVLKMLAIDPLMHGKGLSKPLIFSILKLFPKTKKIKLSTGVEKDIITGKRKHETACRVYVKYGFKAYMEPKVTYDPEEKQFFVWENQEKNY